MNKMVCSFVISFLAAAFSAHAQEVPQDVLKPGTVFHFDRTTTVLRSAPSNEVYSFVHTVTSVGAVVQISEVGRSGKPLTVGSMQELSFPLAVGKTWEKRYTQDVNGYHNIHDVKARVVGEELVSVGGQPAIRTFRVEIEGMVTRTKQSQMTPVLAYYTQTIWYAPSLGYIVQGEKREGDAGGGVASAFSYRLARVDPS